MIASILKLKPKIHADMQHANEINGFRFDPVNQHMFIHGPGEISFRKVGALSAGQWKIANVRQSLLQIMSVFLPLFFSVGEVGVVLDVCKVVLCFSGKKQRVLTA